MSRRKHHNGSPFLSFLFLIVVIAVFVSGGIAVATANDCGDRGQSWEFFPPGWICDSYR